MKRYLIALGVILSACGIGGGQTMPELNRVLLIGSWLVFAGHPATRWVLGGAALFAVSLTFRTLDRSLCPQTALFGGRMIGTHFIWHMCNAMLLYLLLLAAIRHGRRVSRRLG